MKYRTQEISDVEARGRDLASVLDHAATFFLEVVSVVPQGQAYLIELSDEFPAEQVPHLALTTVA